MKTIIKSKYLHFCCLEKITHGNVGGLPRVLHQHMLYCTENTLLLHASNVFFRNQEYSNRVITTDFPVATSKNDSGGGILFKIFRFFKVIKYVLYNRDSFSGDTVFLHDITSLIFVPIFDFKNKILILHSDRFTRFKFESIFVRLFLILSPRQELKIFCPTYHLTSYFKKIVSSNYQNVNYVPSALYFNYENVTNTSEVNSFMFIGRFVSIKKLYEVIMWYNSLSVPNKRLDIYGEPRSLSEKIYLEKCLKIAVESVSYLGISKNPILDMSKHRYVVIFSEGEAIPLTAVEAVIAGAIPIFNRVPGLSDFKREVGGLYYDEPLEEFSVNDLKNRISIYSMRKFYESIKY
jgi:hypothetical protein